MTSDIAAILAMDGIAAGSIYVLMGIGLVLIFSVTRVIFVPFGDLSAITVLTLASLESGRVPGTVGLVVVLAVLATLLQVIVLIRKREFHKIGLAIFFYLVLPLAPAGAIYFLAESTLPQAARIALAMAITLPIAPLLDRLVFRPIADASVLLLLTVALALHFAISGLNLLFYGPEGVRTQPLSDSIFEFHGVIVSGQTLFVILGALVFTGLLFVFFDFTITGKALRATAVNRTAARIVGIRPTDMGTVAYLLASVLAAIAGILIGPGTTIFYDSGFLLGIKAFVGAIFGALASYPLTAVGALLVGLLESFASFFSSNYKEVIVFTFLIPVLIWRSLTMGVHEEADE
jgi:branched-chain amino acid transport system permease protein